LKTFRTYFIFHFYTIIVQDIEFKQYLEENLIKSEDFTSNLNSIIIRVNELDTIGDFHQVNFVHFSFIHIKILIKKFVEDIKDSICYLLKKSLNKDIEFVLDFINKSLETVQIQSQTEEEIKRVCEALIQLSKQIS
jgi:hypothetical protein